jgi:hypothetical protein
VAGYNQYNAKLDAVAVVKNRTLKTENSPVSHPAGVPPSLPASSPSSTRLSVPHPEDSRATPKIAPERLRVIEQRLQDHFYEVPPASEQIAASVLAELNDLHQNTSSLPR